MNTPRPLASIALFLALAAPLAAGEKIKLKTGKVVDGKATAYDADKQELHFVTGGKEEVYRLDQLDARSVYLVHSSVIPKDSAKGQLQLANFARDAGLFEHAARRYGYAEQADPELKPEIDKERIKLRREAADFCLKNAKAASAKKDQKETEKWLSLLLERLPNEPQAAEASALLEASYSSAREAKEAELAAEFQALLEKDLKKGKEAYKRMIESTRKGLTARNDSQASKLWRSAIQDGETVLKEIDKVEKSHGDDPKVREGAVQYRGLTRDQMVEANLHLASQSLVKSSLKDAKEYCNAALALDGKNGEALAMRARIEQAANEGLFPWW